MNLMVATSYLSGPSNLDSVNITTHDEYELIRNLCSRLVERDETGEIVPGIASSFRWDGDRLEFLFERNAKTVDGHIIGAEDAAFSIKRAIAMGKSGHGDIREFLCPNFDLNSPFDDCPGVEVKAGRLILKPAKKIINSHLLEMLDSADFSIVPISATKISRSKSVIADWRNTSGPYYISQGDETGAWVLRANPNHYLFSLEMPQIISLIPTLPDEAIRKLRNLEIDLVPTTFLVSNESIDQIRHDFAVHESIPIRVLMICFTPDAVKRFSNDQRLFAAKALESYLIENVRVLGAQRTQQLFQPLSDGSLQASEAKSIEEVRSRPGNSVVARPITFGVTARKFAEYEKYFSARPSIHVETKPKPAFEMPLATRSDMYILSTDSAWQESVSLIGYNFISGTFHHPLVDAKTWLRDFTAAELKENRIAMLRDLHFKLLKDIIVYPVISSPYFSIARKNLRLNFSPFSGGTELWKVRRAL